MRLLVASLLALSSSIVGCGSSDPTESSGAGGGGAGDGAVADGLPAECNPLRAEGACLLPFPSAAFLDDDATTATKHRVHYTSAMFPKNTNGVAYDPKRLNAVDGFSPAAEILAYFPERLDPASLPPIEDPGKSLSASSATVIVDMDEGKLVAHFAEVDAQVFRDDDRQALILRPTKRLASAHRFAVAVTKATKTLAGGTPASPPAWSAIKAGTATDAGAKKQAARMPAIFDALRKVGVAEDDVVLAWDFVTASDESLTAPTRAVREQTMKLVPEKGLGFTITSVEDDFSQHGRKRVRGTFTVPRFLTQTDVTKGETSLRFDANGKVVADGTYEAPFTFLLPRAAKKGAPVRLLVFGHGFLGSGEGEIGDKGGSYLQDFADAKGYALVATDWSGLSKYEGLDPNGSQAASAAVGDMNKMPWIADRLVQALANGITLARTAKGIAADPALAVDGEAVVDTSRVDYYGISLGGVMGSALMSVSPDLARGALNVGGAGWSTLLQRSQNWLLFKIIVDGAYPDRVDQQMLIEVLQNHFDPIDGENLSPHALLDPLPGSPKKQMLLQMSVNDPSVPNLASEVLARTMGLPLLDDSPLAIYGLDKASAPQSSALTVWDTHQIAPPRTNAPLSGAEKNTAHDTIRMLPKLEEQLDRFFRGGTVEHTCDGACDPE
jgi:pimeloyl-ACP methyl ester carboxylesterase